MHAIGVVCSIRFVWACGLLVDGFSVAVTSIPNISNPIEMRTALIVFEQKEKKEKMEKHKRKIRARPHAETLW